MEVPAVRSQAPSTAVSASVQALLCEDGDVGLLSFDEIRRRLRVVGQTYVGVQEIAVDQIVGSVDREADFDRDFKPRRRLSRSRLASLNEAFADGFMPPIAVFEVGGAYFVEDGHHRVALARERGADFIDAEVTRLQTNCQVPPGVDVARLVHTEQQQILLEETGLRRARPDAVIEFSLLDGYAQLCDIIKAHGYNLARRRSAVPTPEEVAGDWYDGVYLLGVEAAGRAGLRQRYESWGITDADLFLWLYQPPARAPRLRRGRRLRCRCSTSVRSHLFSPAAPAPSSREPPTAAAAH